MDYDRFLLAAVGGFIGGFIYAAPQFLLCYRNHRKDGESVADCYFEFVISVLVAAGAAVTVGPYIAVFMKQTQLHELLALSSFVGLLANRTAPALIRLMSAQPMLQAILKSLGGKT